VTLIEKIKALLPSNVEIIRMHAMDDVYVLEYKVAKIITFDIGDPVEEVVEEMCNGI